MIWVIAHRGASWDEQENTLPAFERAIAVGADYVELDVQLSADGEPVVFHDLDLERLTPLAGPLRRRSAAELREVGVPSLAEVLDVTRGRIGVMAELKSSHLYRRRGLVERTITMLDRTDVVVSFQRRALLETLRLRPELRVIQHVGLGVSIRTASKYAWAVGFWDPRVTRRGLARARDLGLATTVYTVNDAAADARARAAGGRRGLHRPSRRGARRACVLGGLSPNPPGSGVLDGSGGGDDLVGVVSEREQPRRIGREPRVDARADGGLAGAGRRDVRGDLRAAGLRS